MIDNLTVLLSSCDAYEDLWQPFFKLFDKYAGALHDNEIVLNTETKQFAYNGLNIITHQQPTALTDTWGKRLRDNLKAIGTDYVLMILDDFFVRRPIDTETIQLCVNYLQNNPNVGAFNLEPLDGASIESDKFNNFCLIPSDTKYRINAQAAIWRKDVLFDSVLDIESPWEWEVYGNMRNSVTMRDVDIYALKLGAKEPYFYDYYKFDKLDNMGRIECVSAVMRGKWAVDNIDKCFEANGIDIDYSIRGIYTRSKKDVFKSSKLYKFVWRLAKPFRKKKLDAVMAQEQAKIDKFVTPYIK